MLTAHLPSGYLLGTQAARWPWARNLRPGLRLGSAMAGAMAPDLDMLYFWLVDAGRVHHHTYLSHYPALWFSLLLPILLLRRFGATVCAQRHEQFVRRHFRHLALAVAVAGR